MPSKSNVKRGVRGQELIFVCASSNCQLGYLSSTLLTRLTTVAIVTSRCHLANYEKLQNQKQPFNLQAVESSDDVMSRQRSHSAEKI